MTSNCSFWMTRRANYVLLELGLFPNQVIIVGGYRIMGGRPCHLGVFHCRTNSLPSFESVQILFDWHTRGSLRSYSWQHRCMSSTIISEPLLIFQNVTQEHSLIPILEHLTLFDMVLSEVFLKFARANHLRLYVDNSLHNFLVFPINSLSFALFANIIQRLRWRPFNLEIFLIDRTIFRFGNVKKLIQQVLIVSFNFRNFYVFVVLVSS